MCRCYVLVCLNMRKCCFVFIISNTAILKTRARTYLSLRTLLTYKSIFLGTKYLKKINTYLARMCWCQCIWLNWLQPKHQLTTNNYYTNNINFREFKLLVSTSTNNNVKFLSTQCGVDLLQRRQGELQLSSVCGVWSYWVPLQIYCGQFLVILQIIHRWPLWYLVVIQLEWTWEVV